MTFPSVATKSANNDGATGVTSHTITMPASIAAGDLILAAIGARSGVTDFTWPAGWAKVVEYVGANPYLSVYARIADGSEGASIAVTSSVAARAAQGAYRISGHERFALPESSTPANVSGGASIDPNAIAPSWGASDTLWIDIFVCGGSTSITVPAAYTDNSQTSNSGQAGISMASRNNAAASEDSGAGVITGGVAATGVTVAVRPDNKAKFLQMF